MKFNFAVPHATYEDDAIRGVDGNLIPTLKKSRPCRRKTGLGNLNRRHIVVKTDAQPTNEIRLGRRVIGEYEYTYHATKGWRTRRVTA